MANRSFGPHRPEQQHAAYRTNLVGQDLRVLLRDGSCLAIKR